MIDDFNLIKDRNRKNIWVSISGGVDSALLMYLLVKYVYENNLNVSITPWTIVDLYRPGNDEAVKKIISCIQSRYPYHIEENIIDYFYKEKTKKEHSKEFWDRIFKTNRYDLYMNGLTTTPPIDVMKKLNMYDHFLHMTTQLGDTRTLPDQNNLIYQKNTRMDVYNPFINIDKSQLAKIYYEEDLMDDLFPLTQSCIAPKRPCYTCWWCTEKNWAFGLYDMS